MTRGLFVCAAPALALVIALRALPCRAEEIDSAAAQAERLFQQGRKLMDEGRPRDACPKFAESDHLDPAAGTIINLARCYARLGRTASAWTAYREAAERAAAKGQEKREAVARSEAAELEPRLPKLRIVVDEPPSGTLLEVSVDGERWVSDAWNVPTPIDPGSHALVVSAAGFAPWSTTVFSAQATTLEVVVPRLVELSRPQPQPVVPPAPPARRPEPSVAGPHARTATTSAGRTQRVIGVVVGGIGVAGLGVAAAFALNARSLNDRSLEDHHCDATGCDPYGLALNQDAQRAGDVATLLTLSSSAMLLGGVGLYVWGAASERPRDTLSFVPASDGGAELRWARAF